ncbi:MAG: hypothetical protein KIT60_01420 [Burkholderiaceae bacterium]|nr:hypothetical protein [Burkholderiaceae bacterium]
MALSLDRSPFAFIADHPWAYPALEALHVLGIALLVGNLVALELRVWGRAPELPVVALARLSLSIAVVGFSLAAASGLLMFASQPGDLLANRAFTIKMGLVACAGINAALFHARDGLRKLDRWARAQTALSLGLWIAVMICGRWIAYR